MKTSVSNLEFNTGEKTMLKGGNTLSFRMMRSSGLEQIGELCLQPTNREFEQRFFPAIPPQIPREHIQAVIHAECRSRHLTRN